MNNEINNQIQEIINKRSAKVQSIVSQKKYWDTVRDNIKKLKKDVFDIQNLSRQAIASNPSQASQITKLTEQLERMDIRLSLDSLDSSCNRSLDEIKKLMDRFDRKTINIAVAGVGRSGKSTALKSILGIDLTDNRIIPSGSGPAITAGKSSIHSVSGKNEEHTEIFFHTADSFLNDLVRPCLQAITGDQIQCRDLSDVELLDYDSLSRYIEDDSKSKTVDGPIEPRRTQLATLKKIIDSYPEIKALIGGAPQTVPINQTSQFVSYQSNNGKPDICLAVKEAHVYALFPNNSVNSIQLIDLPGLGTSSHIEKKCFLDGFNYSVDMALMLRRPEGISQNFPTEDDLSVINILADVFGDKRLHEVAFLFQNDANLPQADPEKSFKQVAQWNERRPNPLDVLRGNACSAEFMQKTLLPRVLDFLRSNLPQFDEKLLKEANAILNANDDEYRQTLKSIVTAVKPMQSLGMPDINEMRKLFREIQSKLTRNLDDLAKRYGNQKNDIYNETIIEVERLTGEIEIELESTYSEDNTEELERIRDSVRKEETVNTYVNDNYLLVRNLITEKYSELEGVHSHLIKRMCEEVYSILSGAFGSLFPEGETLASVQKWLHEANLSETEDAVKILTTLSAPFYNTIAPEIKSEVFDKFSVDDLTRFILDPRNSVRQGGLNNKDEDKIIIITLQSLRELGLRWVGQIDRVLHKDIQIAKIIPAAIVRFKNCVIQNTKNEDELYVIIQRNFGTIKGSDDASLSEIESRIDNIIKISEIA